MTRWQRTSDLQSRETLERCCSYPGCTRYSESRHHRGRRENIDAVHTLQRGLDVRGRRKEAFDDATETPRSVQARAVTVHVSATRRDML